MGRQLRSDCSETHYWEMESYFRPVLKDKTIFKGQKKIVEPQTSYDFQIFCEIQLKFPKSECSVSVCFWSW